MSTRAHSSANLVVAVGLLVLTPACTSFDDSARGVAIQTGLERLVAQRFEPLRGRRVGIITNHTAVDRDFRHIVDLLHASEVADIVALFGPEHGVRGIAQAGDRLGDSVDPVTGVPIYSLYGTVREPTAEMLEGIDLLLYDIQDVGVRTYTYLSTLLGCLRAAASADIEIWVLDRPNPLGRAVEGPVLEPALESFVGPHPLPLRYGLTIGEFARLVNVERDVGARLRVIELRGWRGGRFPLARSGGWVAPSPNVPTPLTALLYAGFVLIEGTNLGEGRGTTRPFQQVGAPWIEAEKLVRRLRDLELPGVRFRPVGFQPTFSKHAGEICRGVEAHVVDPETFRPVLTAVAVIAETRRQHPDLFEIAPRRFDILAGTRELREAIERGDDPRDIAAGWRQAIEAFRERAREFRLY